MSAQHRINDRRRGHKLVTKEILRKASGLEGTIGQGFDAELLLKIFNPYGSATWYITELEVDEDERLIGFGYVTGLFEDEWGYVDVTELAEAVVKPWGLPLERDCHISGTVREAIKQTTGKDV